MRSGRNVDSHRSKGNGLCRRMSRSSRYWAARGSKNAVSNMYNPQAANEGRTLTSCPSSSSAALAFPVAAIAPAATAAAVLLPVAFGPFAGLQGTQRRSVSDTVATVQTGKRNAGHVAYLNLTFFCLLALDSGAVLGRTGVPGPSDADRLPSSPSLPRETIACALILAAL